jgi:hypothetical protein
VSVASAECSTVRWHGEDLFLAKLVVESCAKSKPSIELVGTVVIGGDRITAIECGFGSCIRTSDCASNSRGYFAWVNNHK